MTQQIYETITRTKSRAHHEEEEEEKEEEEEMEEEEVKPRNHVMSRRGGRGRG